MDVRQLIISAQTKTETPSLYALALALGLRPYMVQRYYRRNRAPRTAIIVIAKAAEIADGEEITGAHSE